MNLAALEDSLQKSLMQNRNAARLKTPGAPPPPDAARLQEVGRLFVECTGDPSNTACEKARNLRKEIRSSVKARAATEASRLTAAVRRAAETNALCSLQSTPSPAACACRRVLGQQKCAIKASHLQSMLGESQGVVDGVVDAFQCAVNPRLGLAVGPQCHSDTQSSLVDAMHAYVTRQTGGFQTLAGEALDQAARDEGLQKYIIMQGPTWTATQQGKNALDSKIIQLQDLVNNNDPDSVIVRRLEQRL